MSTPGKNAKRKAKRRAVVPPASNELPKTLSESDEALVAVIEAAKQVDVEAEFVYPQPTRCTNCGKWCYVLAYLTDEVCGSDCWMAKKQREVRREAQS